MGKFLEAVKRILGISPASTKEPEREIPIEVLPASKTPVVVDEQKVRRSRSTVALEDAIQALLDATNGVEIVSEEQLLEVVPTKFRFHLSAVGSDGHALPGMRIFAFSTHSEAQEFGWRIVPTITFVTGLMVFGSIEEPPESSAQE